MMRRSLWTLCAGVNVHLRSSHLFNPLCVSVAAYVVASAAGQTYRPVTAARLLKPEDGDWLMIRRTYDGWGYSPVEQINAGNWSRLKEVWKVDTGESRVHESAPVVNS